MCPDARTPMPFTIRPYNAKDLPWILEAHQRIFSTEFGYQEEFWHYAQKVILQFHEKQPKHREGMWVAEVEGKPAGCMALVNNAEEAAGQLRFFLVEPVFRGCGIGAALFDYAEQEARRFGYKKVFLGTVDNLQKAVAMYLRRGYVITQRTRNDSWSDTPVHEVRMEKTLV